MAQQFHLLSIHKLVSICQNFMTPLFSCRVRSKEKRPMVLYFSTYLGLSKKSTHLGVLFFGGWKTYSLKTSNVIYVNSIYPSSISIGVLV